MAEETVNETGGSSNALTTVSRVHPGPLRFDRVGNSWEGAKVTNTEAKRIVRQVRSWAAQFDNDDAKDLCEAMDDIEKLFTRVWTEIDESLFRLTLMGRTSAPEKDVEHLAVALQLLHRWQDRGGRIGNAEF